MVVGLLPTAAFAVSNTGDFTVNSTKATTTEIVYGEQSWYVIGANGTGVASESGTITLFAKDNIGSSIKFHASSKPSNVYATSDLKSSVEAIYNGFTSVEKTGGCIINWTPRKE